MNKTIHVGGAFMRRISLVLAICILAVSVAYAQDMDVAGEWQAFQVNELSTYTLTEHQSQEGQGGVTPANLTLNEDGSVETDLQGFGLQTWTLDEGFLLFETNSGNIFFYPRVIADGMMFLVQVDVTERNEEIISIASRPRGNLLVVRP
jgi:hypothetical protein